MKGGGWVVDDDVTPPEGVEPLPLSRWSGWGPPPAVVDLAEWAAWRWAGPIPFFLGVASPPRPVRRLPAGVGVGEGRGVRRACPGHAGLRGRLHGDRVRRHGGPGGGGGNIHRAADSADHRSARPRAVGGPRPRDGGPARRGPRPGSLGRLGRAPLRAPGAAGVPGHHGLGRLRVRVGRSWWEAGPRPGPRFPRLSAALVLDAHDESYREESAPTYSAVDVVTERTRRAGSPCIVTSPCPPTVVSVGRALDALPVAAERAGWSAVERVDRRGADPRSGLFSEEFVRLARAVLDDPDAVDRRGPLVCFYDRTGRARLLACAACGELAQCTTCGAAVAQHGTGSALPALWERASPRVRRVREAAHEDASGRGVAPARRGGRPSRGRGGGGVRPGGRPFQGRTLGRRVGRAPDRARATARAPAPTRGESLRWRGIPATPVLIGTEAVLHRVRRAAAVVFLDIDLHLLAPRFSATDETLALLVRASRMVGPRARRPGVGAPVGADPGARSSGPAGGGAGGSVRGRRRRGIDAAAAPGFPPSPPSPR